MSQSHFQRNEPFVCLHFIFNSFYFVYIFVCGFHHWNTKNQFRFQADQIYIPEIVNYRNDRT